MTEAIGKGSNPVWDRKGKISVVIPVYCSQESLEILVSRLVDVLGGMARDYEIILVDDCSPDNSWEVLKRLKQGHEKVLKIVRLQVNSGQHDAILCGFSMVTGDVVITMDDDLQNPPEEIPKLAQTLDEGYDLVIGAYDSKKHSTARNLGGKIIDRIQRRIFNLPSHFQLTSFRAIKGTVVAHVNQMGAAFPYITSMLFANSSKYKNVFVRHEPRKFGISNYSLRRSFLLATNLIFNYSPYPIYLVAVMCIFAFLFAFGFGSWTIWKVLHFGTAVPGWASTVVIMTFFNGLILLSLLIFGIYISRLHQQTTRMRTRYKIAEIHE